jgi:enamine deaminase RidA (YjgF/YER057c/UK114 family)
MTCAALLCSCDKSTKAWFFVWHMARNPVWRSTRADGRLPPNARVVNQKEPKMSFSSRLAELGVTLPEAPAPAANYVPFVRTGNVVHVSGQISSGPDGMIKGKLGETMDAEAGAKAARQCAISLLAQVKAACGGDIDRLVRVVKLTGFVNSTPDFGDQPKVINGASDFLVEALGEAGRHARSAVSAASLPFGVAVEIEGIFEVK